MKVSRQVRKKVFKWLLVLIIIACSQIQTLAQSEDASDSAIVFTVKTFDGLELPAQVLGDAKSGQKLIVFISGSTPYDHRGNQWAGWDGKGNIVSQKQDFYARFLDIMSSKGYQVATMAKRSFVDSQRIPRPNLNDLALDISCLIRELKNKEQLRIAQDLVIVGYSEGSLVATKVLPMLKEQPAACVLLGSGSGAFNFKTQSWKDWYQTDVLRRMKGWSDQQIRTEFEQVGQIMTTLLEIDEESFEGEYKKSNPYGFGFAPWESFHIDREAQFYDPIPSLLTANIPVLICIGQNDTSMPMVLARRTHDQLLENGYQKASFTVIEGEVHQYKKYDVFAIIDTWIDSGYRSTEFVLDEQDKQIMASYEASADRIARAIDELPWQGAPEKALECFRRARGTEYQEPDPWFKLGLVLFDAGHYEESLYSFKKATDPDFIVCFASMTWIGHINDLRNNRQEAVSWYKKALAHDPGFPVQHDHLGITIDKKWIEDRLTSPFTGIK